MTQKLPIIVCFCFISSLRCTTIKKMTITNRQPFQKSLKRNTGSKAEQHGPPTNKLQQINNKIT